VLASGSGPGGWRRSKKGLRLPGCPQSVLYGQGKSYLQSQHLRVKPLPVRTLAGKIAFLRQTVAGLKQGMIRDQVLNLVLACGYLAKILGNARVARYMGQHHAEMFRELETISETSSLEN
jgi:hypothetical protein